MRGQETGRRGDGESLTAMQMATLIGAKPCYFPLRCNCTHGLWLQVWLLPDGRAVVCERCITPAYEHHMRTQAHLDSLVEANPHELAEVAS